MLFQCVHGTLGGRSVVGWGEAMKRHSRKGIHRCSVRSMRYIGWAVRHGASSVGKVGSGVYMRNWASALLAHARWLMRRQSRRQWAAAGRWRPPLPLHTWVPPQHCRPPVPANQRT